MFFDKISKFLYKQKNNTKLEIIACKEKILKIDSNIINEKGVVSEEIAELMSKNIRKMFNSSIGISITGLAGPTKGTGKDKGTLSQLK